ncbi:hypothetical protein A1O1_01628 [Capronia coronata CBS 617.96]|uniref:MutL C-terminal dimerisation domain-containing protein n=1 Tax=Capronia coronata CBS 617.96 TaxID=1182541 RepID=W9YUC1_9EURO|nr:uncharacterized protein A1O1_01628 [Capronia coronata CBS 617.96]EXJ96502.1 hypothetical protein A1O1_01628 [Capronia coronata CBS 617.96]
MAFVSHSIALLSENVCQKISSSQQITSHEDVIDGLVENALDADARSVVVEVDFAKGYFSVRDDGFGIEGVEFTEAGHLAKPHCTSKLNSSRATFGRYGRFLPSLSSLSLLSITSRRQSDARASRLILSHGEVISRQLALDSEDGGIAGHGTTVVVHNLFGNIPVRSQHTFQYYSSTTETGKAFDQVKRRLVGYLLARSGAFDLRLYETHGRRQYVHVSPRDADTGDVTIESTVSIIFQARLLPHPDSTSWKLASIRSNEFFIRAVFSLKPCPVRDIQYISIGQIPMTNAAGNNELFEAINKAFQRSSFGAVGLDQISRSQVAGRGDRDRGREVLNRGKRIDKWPMFYIRVDPISDNVRLSMGLDEAPAEIQVGIDRLIKALETLVSYFLQSYGFERPSRGLNPTETQKSAISAGHQGQQPLQQSMSARQSQQLNNWHRIKSGRHSFHSSGRPHIPKMFSKSQVSTASGGKDQLSVDILGKDQADSDNLDGPEGTLLNEIWLASNAPGNDDAVSALLWTDPRNGRVVRRHPRTGAVLPSRSSDFSPSVGLFPSHTCLSYRGRTTDGSSALARSGNLIGGAAAQMPQRLSKYCKLPIFHRSESAIQSLDSAQRAEAVTSKHAKSGNSLILRDSSGHVTKDSLARSTVVGQVDRKFILATIVAKDDESKSRKPLLVLVDQHAADERIILENLCREMCMRKHSSLDNPIIFEIDPAEAKMFEEQREYFEEWCFTYSVEWNAEHTTTGGNDIGGHSCAISVTTLPTLIAERCYADPVVLVDLLRREIWSKHSSNSGSLESNKNRVIQEGTHWVTAIANCPTGVLEMLKSRSCRTAIMFNDVLDPDQCGQMVRQLARCAFPFQCAHGRPTVTVLGSFTGLDGSSGSRIPETSPHNGDQVGFGVGWKTWTVDE